MSTEAMRKEFEDDHFKRVKVLPRKSKLRPDEYKWGDSQDEWVIWQRAWQAASANQDEVAERSREFTERAIRATVEASEKIAADFITLGELAFFRKYKTDSLDSAIRQITPEHIMASLQSSHPAPLGDTP